MDETKKKIIDQVKAAIKKQFDSKHVDLDIPLIYDDASGLASLKHMRCGCCSEYVFDDTLRENISEFFTEEDQQKVVEYFVHCLMDMYDMRRLERMSKETCEHLDRIVTYLMETERKHYEELDNPDNHIFVSADWIREWMSQ